MGCAACITPDKKITEPPKPPIKYLELHRKIYHLQPSKLVSQQQYERIIQLLKKDLSLKMSALHRQPDAQQNRWHTSENKSRKTSVVDDNSSNMEVSSKNKDRSPSNGHAAAGFVRLPRIQSPNSKVVRKASLLTPKDIPADDSRPKSNTLAVVSNNPKPKQSQEENKYQQVPQSELRRYRWKLLILCSGLDLQDDRFFKSGKKVQAGPWNLQNAHTCFQQIQIDLDRTFPGRLFKQQSDKLNTVSESPQTSEKDKQDDKGVFRSVLRKIALYFPRLGYTQGMNFMVGYLLLQGFSESQAFWIFVHMAVHKDFLLLGTFEDGFPVSLFYCKLFHYLLQRERPLLAKKLFQQFEMNDQVWLFKWFITYFLYSFPLEIIGDIWDMIMIVGGLGALYFAVALVLHVEQQLESMENELDVAGFFSSFRDLDTFHQHVNLEKTIEKSFTLKLSDAELATVAASMKAKKQTVYFQYWKKVDNQEQKNIIVEEWYRTLNKQREEFWKQFREEEVFRFQKKSSLLKLGSRGSRISSGGYTGIRKKQFRFRVGKEKKTESNSNIEHQQNRQFQIHHMSQTEVKQMTPSNTSGSPFKKPSKILIEQEQLKRRTVAKEFGPRMTNSIHLMYPEKDQSKLDVELVEFDCQSKDSFKKVKDGIGSQASRRASQQATPSQLQKLQLEHKSRLATERDQRNRSSRLNKKSERTFKGGGAMHIAGNVADDMSDMGGSESHRLSERFSYCMPENAISESIDELSVIQGQIDQQMEVESIK